MGLITISASNVATVPSYWSGTERVPGNEAWTTIRAGAGTGTDTPTVSYSCSAGANLWYVLRRVDAVFDLTPYTNLKTVTAAQLRFEVDDVNSAVAGFAGNNTYNGVLLTTQNESLRSNVNNTASNHAAVRAGSPVSSLPWTSVNTTGFKTMGFNATGVSYLNTIMTKPLYKGYAIFGMQYYGEYVNVVPTWYSGVAGLPAIRVRRPAYLDLTMVDSDIQINVGNSWKQSYIMPQINIGNVWRPATGMKINIGNVWRTIK